MSESSNKKKNSNLKPGKWYIETASEFEQYSFLVFPKPDLDQKHTGIILTGKPFMVVKALGNVILSYQSSNYKAYWYKVGYQDIFGCVVVWEFDTIQELTP